MRTRSFPASTSEPCSRHPRFIGSIPRSVGRRPLVCSFPGERSPSCNTADSGRSAGSDDQEALLAALARIVPEIAAGWPQYRDLAAIAAGVEQRRENVSEVWAWIGSHDVARSYAGGLFGDVQIASVPTLLEQTADELNALLRTASFYPRISPDQRQALESESVALYGRLGRPIRSSIVAVLVTARSLTSSGEAVRTTSSGEGAEAQTLADSDGWIARSR